MSNFPGCPGSRQVSLAEKPSPKTDGESRPSQLRQWPVQLHLVSPESPYFKNADVLLSADCVA